MKPVRVTFLMPCYAWRPMGGFRVVYEYANRLVDRGYYVTVVHPRRLEYPPPENLSLLQRLRKAPRRIRELVARPSMRWQQIDKRVNLHFVASSHERYIPDGDVLFATAWHTVQSVLACPSTKGKKCYLIQGYETWMGPKALVDNTWRADLRKVVASRWLVEVGRGLGCNELEHIPSAINHNTFHVLRPVETRPQRVAMLFSTVPLKAAADGVRALQIARRRFPDLQAVLFGTDKRQRWIPAWITYMRDPSQERIIKDVYNGSSIILSSSLTEGFPLPPGEGAASGCAIVTTDSGGVRDYVEHGVTGLLSPPSDPAALAENLCLLLGNDELRIKLAKACNSCIRRFNWEHSTDLLEKFIASV
jgi:glycosyltransferase involved in cell wall biosynthesis